MKKFEKTFDEVMTYDHLFHSYQECLNGVRWKGTVQNYEAHAITLLQSTYEDLQNETFETGKFYKFDVMERGKLRHIQSVSIKERVVQKCLCDYCLTPALSSVFIYDNCACIKGKGVHFAMNRFKETLRKCTRDDYILQFDFKSYFESIPHDKLIYRLSKVIVDEKLMRLIAQLINDFDGDYGLGLGSQISQICALYYPSYIDHYFSCREGVVAYARYMDDGYMIAHDKETLRECKKELERLASNLGLTIHPKKTNIIKLNNTVTFLKARFYLTNTGKIIVKPNRQNIGRNRRKLKILAKKVMDGTMKIEDYKIAKQSVLGNLKHFDCYHLRKNLDQIDPLIAGEELLIHGQQFGEF